MDQVEFNPGQEELMRKMYADLPKGPWSGMSDDDKKSAATAWDYFRYIFKTPETEAEFDRVLLDCKSNDPFGKYFEPWPNYFYRPPLTEEELAEARAEAARFQAECEALGIKIKK